MNASATEYAAMAYSQLAGLLKAGMPLPQALRTLANDARRGRFKAALDRVAAEMDRGTPAEAAFRNEEKALGGMLTRVAASTAASGKLPELLSELAHWTLTQDRIRREIRDALSYPLMVLFFASGIFLAISLSGICSAATDELDITPAMSVQIAGQTAMGLSILGVSLPLVALIARLLASCVSGVQRSVEEFCIRMPIFRTVCRPVALTRFCSSVALLMKAGVAYHDAVAAAGALTGFWPFERAAQRAAGLLEKGESQAEAWERIKLFPASLRFMTRCGAERGEIPESFEELARLYEAEALGRARLLSVLVPPFCLLFLGAMAVMMMCSLLWPLISTMERLGM